ncbi:MAG: NTP transferase domain-containing protein [Archaeoglobus sp.]|nr:NTP transferase domain-containing protein [Archaeoglobus sp.]
MQAVVLAAGEGTRMRPLTFTRPKVMLPIANRPILEHLFVSLKEAGVSRVVLVVGYRDETIRDYFGNEWDGISIEYANQRRQLGTADALKAASHLLEEKFLMMNGDAIVSSSDISKIARQEGFALAVKEVPNPEEFGVVECEGEIVKNIVEKPEKPESNLINAGIYLFTKEILDFVDKTPQSVRGEYEITTSIKLAIESGIEFKAVEIDEWIDVGFPWDLLRANAYFLSKLESRIDGEVEEGAHLIGDVIVGEGSVVKSGAYIEGPVVIGRNCKIGPNCYIRPSTSIGDNCHVGAGVEIKNSIVMNRTKIPHLSYLGDSVIGENCNFGAGTKIANLRLDDKNIMVNVKNRLIDTKLRKFGAVVGDNVRTGINVTINVGTMIGDNVFIAPAAKVDGYVERNSKVF